MGTSITQWSSRVAPGDVFDGRYRVLRALGDPADASGWVVEPVDGGEPRVLRLWPVRADAGEALHRRFAEHACVGARTGERRILHVREAGALPDPPRCWTVSELIEGEDLEEFVRQRDFLPADEVRRIMGAICEGLAAAHAASVAHGDLKPKQVLLVSPSTEEGTPAVKILGFGRWLLSASEGAAATHGSPLWMAPEQTAGREISAVTDVWALGLMAFRLLTGRHYWHEAQRRSPSVMSVLREVALDPIAPASARAREFGCGERIPAGFDAWFARCVARQPEERFADAAAALATLDRAFDDEAPPAAGAANEAARAAAAWAERRRQRHGPRALLVLSVVVAGAAGMLIGREHRTRSNGVSSLATPATVGSKVGLAPAPSDPGPHPAAGEAPKQTPAQNAREHPARAPAHEERRGGAALGARRSPAEVARAGALQRGCASGHARACLELGLLVEHGGRTKADRAQALLWFQRACDGGVEQGCEHLVRSLQRACDHRIAASCTALGALYLGGRRLPRDPDLGVEYLRRGCREGDRDGCALLDRLAPDPADRPRPPPRSPSLPAAPTHEV